MAHLLLGLFRPQQGELMLDGLSVSDEEMPAWQANCAFVPQQIRLLDASIRENVAFCEEPELIDDDRVWAALEAAQFADVVGQMPYGLFTMCGENGMKLSGGSGNVCPWHERSIERRNYWFWMKPPALWTTKLSMM